MYWRLRWWKHFCSIFLREAYDNLEDRNVFPRHFSFFVKFLSLFSPVLKFQPQVHRDCTSKLQQKFWCAWRQKHLSSLLKNNSRQWRLPWEYEKVNWWEILGGWWRRWVVSSKDKKLPWHQKQRNWKCTPWPTGLQTQNWMQRRILQLSIIISSFSRVQLWLFVNFQGSWRVLRQFELDRRWVVCQKSGREVAGNLRCQRENKFWRFKLKNLKFQIPFF